MERRLIRGQIVQGDNIGHFLKFKNYQNTKRRLQNGFTHKCDITRYLFAVHPYWPYNLLTVESTEQYL